MSSASRMRRVNATQRAGAAQGARAAGTPKSRANHSLRARARYAFDNSMSRGPSALIWYLGGAVMLLVLAFAALLVIFSVGPTSNPITAIYNVLLHTIDTGTQAGDVGTAYSALDLVVTFAGIFIFSAFIGVLSNSIDSRLHDLRKGRSPVIESDHTLVLGWSESIFTIVSELAIANESRRGASIVILADMDKVEMEDSIRGRVTDLRGTRVVCRTGNPIAVVDLELVNHQEARSVIVLAPDGDDPDAMVIKTLLALTRGPGRREHDYHIVAEILDAGNLDAAYLAGGDEVVILDKSLTASRMIVQTSRQCGAAFVYQELLDFDGDEIYMRHDESLTGRTYGDALLAYENCSVIGLRHGDGDVKLNPAPGTPIAADDQVIAVAEDDSVLDVAGGAQAKVDRQAIRLGSRKDEVAESTLILGFNPRTPMVIAELERYAQPGSRVELVAAAPPAPEALAADTGELKNLKLSVRSGNATNRAFLDGLGAENFDRVIVMCDADARDSQRADARVLIQLLHLRELAGRTGAKFTIVSEILDEADRELASVAEVDDIVVSDQVISYLLAQISENRDLTEVFTELLESDGSEVYMRPIEDYVATGSEVNFATLIAAACDRGETAFGYRTAGLAYNAKADFGVRVNPAKSETLQPAAGDKLIVLAES